jgi:hypothetical protein
MNQRTNIFKRAVGAIAAAGVVASLGVGVASAHAATSDSINFAHYTIRDWKAEGPQSMIIETVSGDHYRATFMNRCHNLPFRDAVGFETSPGGTFDKFSSVHVGGQKCIIKSLEKIG